MSLGEVQVEDIRAVNLRLLTGLGVAYPIDAVVPAEFFSACCKQAETYGFDLRAFERSLRFGADMAYTAYRHLDEKPRIFIALYTATFLYHDDILSTETSSRFVVRLMEGLPQGSDNLDATARLLRDTSSYSPRQVIPAIAVASWLNLMFAITLENISDRMPIHPQGEPYTSYKRYMSGLGDIYAMMVFPHTIPLDQFVQAIPDLSRFICVSNDVMSFYKEESGSEATNLVNDLANLRGVERIQIIGQLAEDSINMHRRIVTILGQGTPAREAYNIFLSGYIQFHTTAVRYRMKELNIPVGAPFA